jgi:hypothetical protein
VHEESVEPMQARDFFDEPPAQAAPRERAEPVRVQAAEPRSETLAPMPAVPAAPAVVFHAVSEHDAVVEDETHRPARRRRHGSQDAEPVKAPLQLVETQVEVAMPVATEEEPPRRTTPRRRRGGPVVDEPLKLVETQPGDEGTRAGNPP